MNYVDHPTLATLLLQVFHTAQECKQRIRSLKWYMLLQWNRSWDIPLLSPQSGNFQYTQMRYFLVYKVPPRELLMGTTPTWACHLFSTQISFVMQEPWISKSSTRILQHSRNSNVKCFAGYMLFLEEQLEARATGLTICLFDMQQLHTADLEDYSYLR